MSAQSLTTMTLFACPNEVLEHIILELSPDELENFASTCKLLRTLSRPMLEEHYSLKRRYGYKINYPAKKALHPVEILDAIIEFPKAASYIRALSLTYRAPDRQDDKAISAILEKHNCFWGLLSGNPFIMCGEVRSYYQRIKEGHIDATYALLLYYLHNLKELRIQRPILIPMASVMISRLKRALHEPLASGSLQCIPGFQGQEYPKVGLARLERVIIDPATSSNEAHLRNRLGDFARFAGFAGLPNLQHLNGISLCTRKSTCNQTFLGFANLRSIRLVNCNIAPDTFGSLFRGIANLESFHYVPTADCEDLTKVVESLRRHADHSLTRLYLRHSVVETRSEAWKYRGFGRLKRIDLDWRGLVHHELPKELASRSVTYAASAAGIATELPLSSQKITDESQKMHHPGLVDLMPSTVESIKIVDLDGNANLEAVRWLFFKLAMRIGRFPNLKVIIFVTPRKDCWLHAKAICSRINLKFPAYSCAREKRLSGIEFVYE